MNHREKPRPAAAPPRKDSRLFSRISRSAEKPGAMPRKERPPQKRAVSPEGVDTP